MSPMPWHTYGGQFVTDGNHNVVCCVASGANAAADQALITAAPTMEKALAHVLEYLLMPDGDRSQFDDENIIRVVKHALESSRANGLQPEQTIPVYMKRCPSCDNGQWEGECCNGAGGCDCKGEPVPMGPCHVCAGTGQVRADMVGVNTSANAESIRGRCFLGSGPTRGYWAGK